MRRRFTVYYLSFSLIVVGCESPEEIDKRKWAEVISIDTVAAYEDYLDSTSTGAHRDEAEYAMERLRWEYAKELNTEKAYQNFIDAYSSSAYRDQAQEAIQLLRTVTEIQDRYFDSEVSAKGVMTFTATGADCGNYNYYGEFETIGQKKIPQGKAPGFFMAFVPGVKHKYLGSVCIPILSEPVTVTEKIKGSGRSNVDGKFDFDGVIQITNGEISYVLSPGRYFHIKSEDDEGLMLKLTTNGYTHIEGSGTVEAPNGKQYTFLPRITEAPKSETPVTK